MCATFQLSTNMWVNCTLTSGFQMPLPILRSKADVSLALKLQSHSWQQHNVSSLSSYLAVGWCLYVLSAFQKTQQTISLTFSLKKHRAHSTAKADLQCSADCSVSWFCRVHKKGILSHSSYNTCILFNYQLLLFSCNYLGMLPLLDTEHIRLLQVWAKLVHVQSNHRLCSRSHHQTTRGRQLLDQLIFPGNCCSCLR